MKILFTILSVVLLCSCAGHSGRKVSNEGIVAGITAPETLQLLNESYAARYSASEGGKCVVEYYLAGDGPKSWKKMLALRYNEAGLTSLQQVENIETSIKTGGANAVRSYKDTNTGGYGIEFTVMGKEAVVLDVYRFMDRTNGSGTISFQYAEKIPFDQLRAVGEAKVSEYYAGIRSKVVKAMNAIPMPKIDLAKPKE